jgi:GDPmannose 4,6-dehydratase
MFGDQALSGTSGFNETSSFKPMSPYAASKIAALTLCMYYIGVLGVDIRSAISFNHESPFRNELFVT